MLELPGDFGGASKSLGELLSGADVEGHAAVCLVEEGGGGRPGRRPKGV